jgi:nickel transport system ATP-binding protein
MIFVSHDLGVVRRLSDEVLVMKDGEIVESGTTRDIFTGARHAYTRYLVSAKQALNRQFQLVMGGSGIAEG